MLSLKYRMLSTQEKFDKDESTSYIPIHTRSLLWYHCIEYSDGHTYLKRRRKAHISHLIKSTGTSLIRSGSVYCNENTVILMKFPSFHCTGRHFCLSGVIFGIEHFSFLTALESFSRKIRTHLALSWVRLHNEPRHWHMPQIINVINSLKIFITLVE